MARKNKTQAAIEKTKVWLEHQIKIRGKNDLIYPHCMGEEVSYGELLLVLLAAQRTQP